MKKLHNVLKENMRRFKTKNLNEQQAEISAEVKKTYDTLNSKFKKLTGEHGQRKRNGKQLAVQNYSGGKTFKVLSLQLMSQGKDRDPRVYFVLSDGKSYLTFNPWATSAKASISGGGPLKALAVFFFTKYPNTLSDLSKWAKTVDSSGLQTELNQVKV